ncbi:DUF4253 domain-containing protein [Streptomyces sp. NPDC001089]
MTSQDPPGAVPEALRALPAGLPAGRLRAPDEDGGCPRSPVLWISDGPLDDADVWWERLGRHRPATGLRPVLFEFRDDPLRPGDARDGSGTEVERRFLDEWRGHRRRRAEWAALPPVPPCPEEEEFDWPDGSPPFDAWPGLAAARPPVPEAEADDRAAAAAAHLVREEPLCRLALVPVARSADIPAAIGWTGTNGRLSAGDLSGVLRSWEDRFGARLVGLGHGTAFVSAAAGPVGLDEAHRLALEHYLTSPDTIEQGMVTFSEYAAGLLGRPIWRLWWD